MFNYKIQSYIGSQYKMRLYLKEQKDICQFPRYHFAQDLYSIPITRTSKCLHAQQDGGKIQVIQISKKRLDQGPT